MLLSQEPQLPDPSSTIRVQILWEQNLSTTLVPPSPAASLSTASRTLTRRMSHSTSPQWVPPLGPKDVTITNPDGQSSTGTGILTVVGGTTATPGQLNISEFRLRGPGGVNDEFIEIYNASGGVLKVSAATGNGFGVVASDGILRCTIPNGTVFPNRSHYLCANSLAYSLSAYAAADATYTTDIADNVGIALFNSDVSVNFTNASRLDSVGSASEANPLYKEGTGYRLLPRSQLTIHSSVTLAARAALTRFWVRARQAACLQTPAITPRISTSSPLRPVRANVSVRLVRRTSPRPSNAMA